MAAKNLKICYFNFTDNYQCIGNKHQVNDMISKGKQKEGFSLSGLIHPNFVATQFHWDKRTLSSFSLIHFLQPDHLLLHPVPSSSQVLCV